MTLFRNKYRIESARMQGHDYSSPGAYFVTAVTKDRVPFFGRIVDGKMELSEIGGIVADEWRKTALIRKNVQLDEWVVMPDHLHGILIIRDMMDGDRVDVGIGVGVDDDVGDVGDVDGVDDVETNRRFVSTHTPVTPPVTPPITEYTKPSPSRMPRGNKPNSIGAIMAQFKSVCTKRIHRAGMPEFGWQPRYHDRIIRDDTEWARIRKYIIDNPSNWNPNDTTGQTE
jgi:REP element-mobilizing transposase RayT